MLANWSAGKQNRKDFRGPKCLAETGRRSQWIAPLAVVEVQCSASMETTLFDSTNPWRLAASSGFVMLRWTMWGSDWPSL